MESSVRQSKALKKWAKIVQEWKLSGQKAIEWCRGRNISYPYFITWRKRFEKMNAENTPSLFMELQDEKTPKVLEIHCQDFTVTVPEQFDPQSLLKCLRILRSV